MADFYIGIYFVKYHSKVVLSRVGVFASTAPHRAFCRDKRIPAKDLQSERASVARGSPFLFRKFYLTDGLMTSDQI